MEKRHEQRGTEMNGLGEVLKLVAAGAIGGLVTVFGDTLEFWNKNRDHLLSRQNP